MIPGKEPPELVSLHLAVKETEKRLFRMGLIAAIAGFINILSLFLSWYVHTAENLQSAPILGYMRVETLAPSLLGGVIASTGIVSSGVAKRLKHIKRAESALVLAGGIIAIISPIVMTMYIVPGLEAAGGSGYLDVGLFVSAISGAAVVLIGAFILLIPVGVGQPPPVVAQPPVTQAAPSISLPRPPLPTDLLPVQRRGEVRTVVMSPAEELVEGAMCTICYEPLELPSTVKCSACGALYHQGCINAWVDLNGICPNCKNPVEETYPY